MLYFFDFVPLFACFKLPKGEYLIKGKGLYAALFILIRTLHGCHLLESAGAYSPE
jgi:hypothetical protein